MLPGCTLHEAVCTAFFDLPESLRRGRLSVESEELLPGQGILGVEDRERFRILEVRDEGVVESILADHSWSTDAADLGISLEWAKSQVADSDGYAEKYERVLRWLAVLACAGAPIAMMLCVVCLNITRACFDHKRG